jgi:hypothetical protein
MKSKGLFLALVLAVGFGAVWGMFSMWGVAVVEHVAGFQERSARLVVLVGGTPALAESNASGETTYRDLEGKPLERSSDRMQQVGGSALAAGPPRDKSESWDRRIRAFADGGTPAVFWYFLEEDGGYFVGYDSRSKTRVGYLGTAGFRDGMPSQAERFPFLGDVSGVMMPRVLCNQWTDGHTSHPRKDGVAKAPAGTLSAWDVFVLGGDDALYHADLRSRTVERVKGLPPVRSASIVLGLPDLVRGTPTHVAARTDADVLILDDRGGILKRYPVPDALRGRLFTFVETADGEGLMLTKGKMDPLAAKTEQSVFWVKPDGRFRVSEVTLPRSRHGINMPVAGGVVTPSPVALAGTVAAFGAWELQVGGFEGSYPEALRYSLRIYWRSLVIAQLVAIALAVLCYRRQLRYGATPAERVLWPLFVLALGLPGYVGYRFGRSWPVLETCSGCNALVPRDRDACARCAAEFPAPALLGTEVFA